VNTGICEFLGLEEIPQMIFRKDWHWNSAYYIYS